VVSGASGLSTTWAQSFFPYHDSPVIKFINIIHLKKFH